jgi:hypothetical protein
MRIAAIDRVWASAYDVGMGKVVSFLFETAGRMLDHIELEKFLIRPPSTKQDRDELLSILDPKALEKQPSPEPEEPDAPRTLRPRQSTRRPVTPSAVTDEETVDYQNRELGKLLLRMERHYAQGLRINGKICDCGATKHLIDIEGMAEETIPITDSPEVYERIIAWVNRVGPVSTVDAVSTGKFDDLYPQFSQDARDFRKEIIGTLDAQALWPNSHVTLSDLVKRAGDVKVVKVEKPKELPPPMMEAPAEPPQEEEPAPAPEPEPEAATLEAEES